MVKRIFAVLTIAFVLVTGINITTAKSTDCEHYFRTESLAGITYLIEFDCDGMIVAVTVIDD